MAHGTAGAGAGAAAAAAIANAIKASGAIVKVDPEEFLKVLGRSEEPLVAISSGGFFSTTHRYLTSYKGLIFYAESKQAMHLPGSAEVITCRKIWIPG
jgi:hypothetical protein